VVVVIVVVDADVEVIVVDAVVALIVVDAVMSLVLSVPEEPELDSSVSAAIPVGPAHPRITPRIKSEDLRMTPRYHAVPADGRQSIS
jgi:hypothetical protein